MLHGEFGRGGAPYEDRGTVDAVVAQKVPVGDAFPHRDDFSHGLKNLDQNVSVTVRFLRLRFLVQQLVLL